MDKHLARVGTGVRVGEGRLSCEGAVLVSTLEIRKTNLKLFNNSLRVTQLLNGSLDANSRIQQVPLSLPGPPRYLRVHIQSGRKEERVRDGEVCVSRTEP